jgi:hypothetical protein
MKFKWIVLAGAGLISAFSIVAADPALARVKKHYTRHAKVHCVDRPQNFSWDFIWTLGRDPKPNGCAPPVYAYGRYQGQDPDPFIRQQLKRDPQTGYFPF